MSKKKGFDNETDESTEQGKEDAQLDEITDESSAEEILDWLHDTTKREVLGVAIWIANHTRYRVALSGSKEQLISGLRNVKAEALWAAVEVMFPETEDESEDDDDQSEQEEEE